MARTPEYITDVQVANAAASAGWTGDDLVRAVAVALAEHNGKVNIYALGDVALQNAKWGPSVGIWQIRSLNEQKGTGGVRDEMENLAPTMNAAHAYQIWAENDHSFQPWSTFIHGTYLLYLPRAKVAVGQKTVTADSAGRARGVVITQSPLDVAKQGLHAIGMGIAWIANPHNWARVAMVGIGGAVVVTGLGIAAKGAATQAVSSTVGKAIRDA